MKIDWFTVVAQIMNFLILVWLLKRFLYQPILNAVDTREQKISSRLAAAEAKKAEAREERVKFQEKNETLNRERTAKMEEARKEAEEEKHRLVEEIRKESKALRARHEISLQQEAEQMIDSLKLEMQEEVFSIVRQVLNDLADVSLEERLVKVFVKKINDLDESERQIFSKVFLDTRKVILRSAFELPVESKSELESVIIDMTGEEIPIEYESGPELVSGIVVHADRFSLSWNIDVYLDNLKKNILESMPGNK